jgi:predicted nucleic acid-binding protein
MAEVRVADLVKGKVVDLDTSLAMSAAMLSAELKLPMAESIILTVAREFNATLWTQDEHFRSLPSVYYVENK